MDTNLAYKEEIWEELIGGRLVAMSPRPSVNHSRISSNIYSIFRSFLNGKKSEAFPDGVDLYLSDTEQYIPDGMVVCDPDKVKPDGVHGAPDLVVEILSPRTAKYDKKIKKDVYEACGVREYWIVDPAAKSIEQYLSENGRFTLSDVFTVYPDWMLEKMTDEEKAEVVTGFRCSLYDDLIIRLDDVFYRVDE